MSELASNSSLTIRGVLLESPDTVMFNMFAIRMCHLIVWGILSQTFVIFGIGSNIINIVCFVKQGFKESINVSLTGLAISDLGCLLPLVWSNLCQTPEFADLDWPFEASEFQYMTTGITHVLMARISSWITAAITLERCLCVAMPLKVKEIASPKRNFIIITGIFVVLIAGGSPQYYYYRAGRKYFPSRNRTLTGIVFSQELLDFENISYPINFVFLQFAAFCIIIICTIILVIELHVKAKWRKESVASSNTASSTNSNKRVAKMVLMISALFIGSYIIVSISCILINLVSGFTINGKLRHLLTLVGGLGFFTEAINESVNIFIYYHMSSRYREVFHEIFFLSCLSKTAKASSCQRKGTVRLMRQ